jgi:hypothetical protein
LPNGDPVIAQNLPTSLADVAVKSNPSVLNDADKFVHSKFTVGNPSNVTVAAVAALLPARLNTVTAISHNLLFIANPPYA